ncbi:hypothetical protein ACEWPN_17130 [Yoonia sp. R2-816]
MSNDWIKTAIEALVESLDGSSNQFSDRKTLNINLLGCFSAFVCRKRGSTNEKIKGPLRIRRGLEDHAIILAHRRHPACLSDLKHGHIYG